MSSTICISTSLSNVTFLLPWSGSCLQRIMWSEKPRLLPFNKAMNSNDIISQQLQILPCNVVRALALHDLSPELYCQRRHYLHGVCKCGLHQIPSLLPMIHCMVHKLVYDQPASTANKYDCGKVIRQMFWPSGAGRCNWFHVPCKELHNTMAVWIFCLLENGLLAVVLEQFNKMHFCYSDCTTPVRSPIVPIPSALSYPQRASGWAG